MLWNELNDKEKKKRILETIEKVRDKEVADLFSEFKRFNPEITLTLKQFYDFYLYLEKKGEIEL